MSLKAKVMISMFCLFSFYCLLDYGIQRLIVLPEFARLERTQAKDNLQRSIYAIQREIQHLDSVCHDWSAWDDTYAFIKDRDEAYIKGNLAPDSMKTIGVNLMYLCTPQGKVVWGKVFDHVAGTEVTVPGIPRDAMPIDPQLILAKLTGADLSEVTVSGVILTGRGPILIAARPILRSNNVGPVRGILIMGKFLDQPFVHKLVGQTRVDFSLLLDPALETSLLSSPEHAVGAEFPCRIDYTSNDQLTSLAVYPDVTGKPAFVIKTVLMRDIMKGGNEAMRYALITLVVAGVCVILLLLLFMERTLLHPVTNLTRHVLSISETGNFSLRLRVNRSDEIGTLAREFDRMVSKIEEMNTMMEGINDQLIDDIQKKREMERKLQEANSQLEKLASVDGLTQLSNRRKFDEYLEVEWKRGIRDHSPLSLIIFDVDFFKNFNDTYGHQAGDDCLRSVAGIIASRARRISDLAARYGGEEFAMVLPSTDLEGALHLAEEIRISVRDLAIRHETSGAEQCVTLSAGVSCVVPSKDSTLGDLIRKADVALYDAKAAGRNRSAAHADAPSGNPDHG